MIRAALTLVLLWAAPACAKKPQLPDVVADALAYDDTDREKAARLLEDALEHGPREDDLPWLLLYAGEERRLMGDTNAAHGWFVKLEDLGHGETLPAARLGLLLLDAQRGVDDKMLARLRNIDERAVPATQNADRFLLLAADAARKNDAPAVREYSKKALSWARDDDEVHARVRARLEALADGKGAEDDARTPLERAENALAAGRLDDARRLAQQVIDAGPDTEDAYVARYVLKRAEAAVVVDPNKIGVLLPLSGKFEAAGKQMKQALELGYRGAATTRRLVFVDSGDTTESAVAALEKLALQDGVVAVVGPLLTDVTPEVVRASNALRVPIISLSQAVDVTKDRPWAFQAMVTPRDQVAALLDFVMKQRGMKAFAVFAPDTAYGRTATDVFRDEVAKRGGEVKVVELYDPESTDLVPFAKKLGRKDYEARKAELYKLRQETKELGGDPSKVVLPPVIDYDAIFLPDSAARVPIACAGLAYEEFPIGEFRPQKKVTRTIPLLGLSGWNQETLVTRGGPYVRGSFFTDAYFPADEATRAFEERYRAETGRAPTALEAVGYDAGKLLAAAAKSGAGDRAAFRDAIAAATADGAITGTDAFDAATRSAQHDVRILTITSKAIVAVDDTAVSAP